MWMEDTFNQMPSTSHNKQIYAGAEASPFRTFAFGNFFYPQNVIGKMP